MKYLFGILTALALASPALAQHSGYSGHGYYGHNVVQSQVFSPYYTPYTVVIPQAAFIPTIYAPAATYAPVASVPVYSVPASAPVYQTPATAYATCGVPVSAIPAAVAYVGNSYVNAYSGVVLPANIQTYFHNHIRTNGLVRLR